MGKLYEIWLAEDDLEDFELFKEVLLSSSQQFRFLHFTTGVELLQNLIAEKNKTQPEYPNLIVLDQFMPEKSGWEILELIKIDEAFKEIIVIIMSGTYTQDNIDNGFRMGMDGYIQKPVFIGEWKSIVDKLILTWKPGEDDSSV